MNLAEFELWLEDIDGSSTCSSCAAVGEPSEKAAAPDDPALEPAAVLRLFWYHTSTQSDWPKNTLDPTTNWIPQAFERMERMLGDGAVERWRNDQLRKCLHVGTYEAAIENMARRRVNQADRDSSFFLYRVRLAADAVIRPEIITDPGGIVGDVLPEDVMSPTESITRYINAHEDIGSLSLAIRRTAASSIQKIQIGSPEGAKLHWEEHLAALSAVEWRKVAHLPNT